MKYIVYCTRNNVNSKIYIGVHKTLNPTKFDGYLGCGVYSTNKNIAPTTTFRMAVKKYGANNFTRTVLGIFDTEDEAYLLEKLLVTKEFIKRPDVYNMTVGGKNGSVLTKDKPVYQYDLDGNLLNMFDTIELASKSIDTDYWLIVASCEDYKITCKGFYWRYTSEFFESGIHTAYTPGTRNIKVIQYSKAGYKIKEWESLTEAAISLQCDRSSISSSCKGEPHRKICGGYQWRYASDNLDCVDAIDTKGGPPRKIAKLTQDYVLLESYESIKEAEFKSGISKTSIHKGLKHGKIILGFRWVYV